MVLLTAIVASWGVAWVGWGALPVAAGGCLAGRLCRGGGRWWGLYVVLAAVWGLAGGGPPGAFLAWPWLAWRAAEAGRGAAAGKAEYEFEAGCGAAALSLALLSGAASPLAVAPFAALALAGLYWGTGGWVDELYGLEPERAVRRAVGAAMAVLAGLAAGAAMLWAARGGLWAMGRVLPGVAWLLAELGRLVAALLGWLLVRLPHLGPLHPPALPHRALGGVPRGSLAAAPAWLLWLLRALVVALFLLFIVLIRGLLREAVGGAWWRRGGVPRGPEERSGIRPTDAPRRRGADRVRVGRVRVVFRRWLAMAARGGQVRLPAETAGEHMRRAARDLPGGAALLGAYQRVRYGGEPDGPLVGEAEGAWRTLEGAYREAEGADRRPRRGRRPAGPRG